MPCLVGLGLAFLVNIYQQHLLELLQGDNPKKFMNKIAFNVVQFRRLVEIQRGKRKKSFKFNLIQETQCFLTEDSELFGSEECNEHNNSAEWFVDLVSTSPKKLVKSNVIRTMEDQGFQAFKSQQLDNEAT